MRINRWQSEANGIPTEGQIWHFNDCSDSLTRENDSAPRHLHQKQINRKYCASLRLDKLVSVAKSI